MTEMAVCRWQTVEDGAPRDEADVWGCYGGIWLRGITPGADRALHAIPVRDPVTYGLYARPLVVRASRTEDEITAAIEDYESPDDGA